MKYIRTEDDNIFGIEEKFIGKYGMDVNWIFHDGYAICYSKRDMKAICNHGRIVKEADTIEELCDEFVWIRKNNVLGILPSLDNHKYDIKTAKKHLDKFEIYGAIWTDKGLIYVAKMNEKGELELL